MAKYIKCPVCGAHIDHGEVCDCQQKREEKTEQQNKKPA